jgi:hypothetical protein
MVEVGRNAPCSCGSGRKYKKCCGAPRNEAPTLPTPPMPPVAVLTNPTNLLACILKHLGGEASIPIAMIAGIPKGLSVQVSQEGDQIVLRLEMKGAATAEAPTILLPEPRKIIT